MLQERDNSFAVQIPVPDVVADLDATVAIGDGSIQFGARGIVHDTDLATRYHAWLDTHGAA